MKCTIQVRGEGPRKAKLMVVGEAPGREEAEKKRPFVGRAGRFLSKSLHTAGIHREKCYVTNIVKFRPTKTIGGKAKDRAPTKEEIKACLPYFQRELRSVHPKFVLLLGNTSLKAILDRNYTVGKDHGREIRRGNTTFIATFHPANAMRNRKHRKMFLEDLAKLKALL
jgi:DNA polymerase